MILETERLFLREWEQSDFDDLAQILQNPHVMYAYEHDFKRDKWNDWSGRADNAVLSEYPDIGSGLSVKRGILASWICQRNCIRLSKICFWKFTGRSVICHIKADNISSIKVAESLGMKKVDEFMTGYYNGETLHYLYAIERTK